MQRHALIMVALVLSVGACGKGDSAQPAATTTAEPATTSASPATTLPATTTTSATTTTPPLTTPPVAALDAVLPDASPELRRAVEAAFDSECVTRESATEVLLSRVSGDLGVDSMASVTEIGESGLYVATGLLFTGEYPVTTTDDFDLAQIHSELYMNHIRSYVALFRWAMSPMDFEVYHRPLSDLRSEDGFDAATVPVVARWGAPPGPIDMADYGQELRLEWQGVETTIPFSFYSLLRPPDSDLTVAEDARIEAWEIAEGHIERIAAIASGITETAAPQLEEMSEELVDLKSLFCVLLATEQQIAEAELLGHEFDIAWHQNNMEIFFREVAAQEALLAIEYLDVIVDHLARSDVDWLRSADVDLSQSITDNSTSTSEYVYLWLTGIQSTLSSCHDFLAMADSSEVVTPRPVAPWRFPI